MCCNHLKKDQIPSIIHEVGYRASRGLQCPLMEEEAIGCWHSGVEGLQIITVTFIKISFTSAFCTTVEATNATAELNPLHKGSKSE